MTANQPDSDALESAEQGTPTPSSPAQSPTPSDGQVPAWFKNYSEQLDARLGELDRTFKTSQGNARKTENEFRKWMGQVEQLEKRGIPREDAISQIEAGQQDSQWRNTIEKQLSDLTSLLKTQGSVGGVEQAVTTVLSQYGLDPKDPFVASKIQGKSFANDLELKAFAGEVLLEKTRSPQPNAAQVASSPSQATTRVNLDDLYTQMAQAYKEPTKNRELIKSIEKQIKEAGG